MPVCGFLIAHCGWESVFYVTGGIGLVWSVAWFFLVYDSPAQHPRISEEERAEIEAKIAAEAGWFHFSVLYLQGECFFLLLFKVAREENRAECHGSQFYCQCQFGR